jgi:hypothetical protein
MTLFGQPISAFFGSPSGLTGALFSQPGPSSSTDPIGAMRRAEKNTARKVADKAEEPQVARELQRFETAVRRARSVDELLRNRDAMRVILTANGLESQQNAQGLVRRALTSDLRDADSTVYQLARTNGNWLTTARDLDLQRNGLRAIQSPETIARLKIAYAQTRWEDSLENQAPGLSLALVFKRRAAAYDEPIKVLGDPVAREVVTTTLGIPKDLARQSLEAQQRAISNRIDVTKFKDPQFVDKFVQRYLLAVNTGSGNFSVTA